MLGILVNTVIDKLSSPEYVFKANEKVFIGFTNEDSPLNVDVRKCVATPDISISPPPPGLYKFYVIS